MDVFEIIENLPREQQLNEYYNAAYSELHLLMGDVKKAREEADLGAIMETTNKTVYEMQEVIRALARYEEYAKHG